MYKNNKDDVIMKNQNWQAAQTPGFGLRFVLFLVITLSLVFSAGALVAQDAEMPIYSVSVTGSVRIPGVYHVPISTRVSELISLANYVEKMPADTLSIDLTILPSLRNVIHTQKGETTSLDVLRFYRLGDISQNPYVMDGDVVHVPAIQQQVMLFGAIQREGSYELRDGDRLSDIIDLALGMRDDADASNIIIRRFTSSSTSKELHPDLTEADMHPDQNNPLLHNDDVIIVQNHPEFHPEYFVKIEGEVAHPGVYPIDSNKTTLLDILTLSGGPTEKADLTRAIVERKNSATHTDTEFERLLHFPPDEFTNVEYEYMKTKFRQKDGKYAVNLKALWESKDATFNIPLQDSTYIYIPPVFNSIKVMGHVKNPGFITYEPDKSFLYYIEQSGGYSWNARKSKVRIIRASTGEWLKPNKKTVLEPGDYLFVPERPPYDYLQYTKDVLTILAQAATIIIGINNITQK